MENKQNPNTFNMNSSRSNDVKSKNEHRKGGPKKSSTPEPLLTLKEKVNVIEWINIPIPLVNGINHIVDASL